MGQKLAILAAALIGVAGLAFIALSVRFLLRAAHRGETGSVERRPMPKLTSLMSASVLLIALLFVFVQTLLFGKVVIAATITMFLVGGARYFGLLPTSTASFGDNRHFDGLGSPEDLLVPGEKISVSTHAIGSLLRGQGYLVILTDRRLLLLELAPWSMVVTGNVLSCERSRVSLASFRRIPTRGFRLRFACDDQRIRLAFANFPSARREAALKLRRELIQPTHV